MIPHVIEQGPNGQERVYDLYSRMLKDRIIFVKGVFDQDMADSVVAQLLFLESQDAESDIMMYINSPGGCLSSMYAIYDTMQYIKPDIATVGIGQCVSAASFILAAGTMGKRHALPNTEIMIHELSTGTEGKANQIRNYVKHMEYLWEKMAKHYVKYTGQKLSKIKRDMEIDYFMSADEAQKYGLIDEVHERRG